LLELRLVRSFVAVAEAEHVGRAAAALHISQSPLSRQIRRLEDDLGLVLFARSGRRVALTSAGRWLLGEARALLQRAARLESDAARLAQGASGSVAIGYVQTAMWSGLLPAVLRGYRRRHPEVRLVLRNLPSAPQIDELARGDLDLAIVHVAPAAADLAATLILDDPLLLAAASDHELARRRRVDPADLDGKPWVALAGSGKELAYACARAGFSPDVRYQAGDRASVLALVAAGFGLAFVPASARKVPAAGVRLRALPWLRARSRLYLVQRDSGATPGAAELAAALCGRKSR
jgi:DNA-binding transcriptional LysR family regulator